MTSNVRALNPKEWLRVLDARAPTRSVDVAGEVLECGSLLLLRKAVDAFLAHYGPIPLRIFRAPARVNLRGMHIDNHGGWLNQLTHGRELYLMAARSEGDVLELRNADPAYAPASIDPQAHPHPPEGQPWGEWVVRADMSANAELPPWTRYVLGAWHACRHRWGSRVEPGLRLIAASEIPPGASLSSSAALCVAAVQAIAGMHHLPLTAHELAVLARQAEWYTGSRCGIGDQLAIVMCRQRTVLHLAVDPEKGARDVRHIPLPHNATVIVADSGERRTLSGDRRIHYAAGRMAYGFALEMLARRLREEAPKLPPLERLAVISKWSPEAQQRMVRVLEAIPPTLDLARLAEEIGRERVDAKCQEQLGQPLEACGSMEVALRGPLLFALGESQRAALFAQALECHDLETAGIAMTWGHAGDRIEACDPCEEEMAALIAGEQVLAKAAGAFGASTPALDVLVDAALAGGACGASLTGAGMGGCIVALTWREQAPTVCAALDKVLPPEGSVDFIGTAPAAGELLLPRHPY